MNGRNIRTIMNVVLHVYCKRKRKCNRKRWRRKIGICEKNTLFFVVRTDKGNWPSINLAYRLGFQRDANFDDFTDKRDIFFFKNLI